MTPEQFKTLAGSLKKLLEEAKELGLDVETAEEKKNEKTLWFRSGILADLTRCAEVLDDFRERGEGVLFDVFLNELYTAAELLREAHEVLSGEQKC